MKKTLFLLSFMLFATGVIFNSCGDKVVPEPKTLSVTNITETGAKFTWSGTGDSYEIVIGTQTYTTTTPSYTATNLTKHTNYTWKVRAKKGDNYSSWVNGPNFTTLDSPPLPPSVKVEFGTEVWTTTTMYGLLDEYDDLLLRIFKNGYNTFPYIALYPPARVTDGPMLLTYRREFPFTWYHTDWERTLSTTPEGQTEAIPIGDWCIYNDASTVDVTKFENGQLSCVIILYLQDLYDKVENGNQNPEKKTLKVTITNMPYTQFPSKMNLTRRNLKITSIDMKSIQKLKK
jgi:hypothetical protein